MGCGYGGGKDGRCSKTEGVPLLLALLAAVQLLVLGSA
jgi:hypothetical protein